MYEQLRRRRRSSERNSSMASQRQDQYDIFLSHSGAQKGFVRELHTALSNSASYSVFFDQDHHSLPPAQPFPDLIFSAAKSCRLAIVVLSEEFVTSPWPMMELCAFAYPDPLLSGPPAVHAASTTILPLFYKLSTAEMKSRGNVERWRTTWKKWEEERTRIRAGKCEEAVTKLLPSLNGIVRRPESEQWEGSYIDEVIRAILSICPSRRRSPLAWPYDDPTKPYFGRERMCQILIGKFRELEKDGVDKVSILGMYGVPGSGKSTLCRCLCDSMFDEFGGNVLILKLPTEFDPNQNHSSHPQIEVLTPWKSCFINEVRELYDLQLLPGSKFTTKRRMFLVLDNICQSNYENYRKIVQAILRSPSPVLDSGSRVMLVSPSDAILDDLRTFILTHLDPPRYRYWITNVPKLTESEAISIVMHAQQLHSKADGRWSSEELTTRLFTRFEDFASSSSSMCIPLVLDMIGVLVGKAAKFDSELENLLEMVHKEKQRTAQRLVGTIFEKLEESLQVLFLDIALFFIPSRLSFQMNSFILRHMQGGISETEWKMNMDELRRHGLLSYSRLDIHDIWLEIHDSRLEIHDVFLEYARSYSISEMSKRYVMVHLPISNSHMECMSSCLFNQSFVLKCHEARTILVELPRHPMLDMVQEMAVDVQVGPEAKALIIKNLSLCTNVNVCLSGDLSSLVYSKLENISVKQLARSPLPCVRQKRKMTLPWRPLLPWQKEHPATYNNRSMANILSFLGTGMRVLHLENVGIQKLDIGSGCLPVLERLSVVSVEEGENGITSLIVGNAPKLKCLNVFIKYPPKMSKSLLELRLDECPELEVFRVQWTPCSRVKVLCSQRSPKLREIKMGFSDESAVQKLIASTNNGHHPVLERLILRYCHNNERLEFTSAEHQQAKLRYIQVNSCPHLRHVTFWPGCLRNLEHLKIYDCDGLVDLSIAPGSLPNLRRFQLSYCKSLTCLQIGSGWLLNLDRLLLWDYTSLIDLSRAQDALRNLRHLDLGNCDSLTGLYLRPGCLPNLDRLYLSDCNSLIDLSIARDSLLNLTYFQVSFCHSLTHLSIGPGCLERLRNLILDGLLQLRCHLRFRNAAGGDVEGQLQYIDVQNCPRVKVDINILEASENLKRVRLERTCISLVPGGLQPDVIYGVLSCKKSLEMMRICNISLYYMRERSEGMLSSFVDDASTIASTNVCLDRAALFVCSDRPGNAESRPSSCLLTVASVSRSLIGSTAQHPRRFSNGTFQSLTKLELFHLPYWKEIQGIHHLVNLRVLSLSELPNLTHVLGEWPSGIWSIEFADCPMLRRIPSFERTSNLGTLVMIKCKELKAVEGSLMKEANLSCLFICECEALELKLSADYGKVDDRRLCVWGSEKVAGVEVMQRWLQEAQHGSAFERAAIHGLLGEYLYKVNKKNQL